MRTNYLFLTAATASMLMLTACTHDDSSSTESAPVSNELIISTRHSEMGITRAESNIQSEQFKQGEPIHVFLRDATDIADSTHYLSPRLYITTNTTGSLSPATDNGNGTYIANSDKLYWPKLMHSLHIYGIYPIGSVGWSARKTTSADADTYTTNNSAFDKTFKYYFTVQADQTSEANYKASDLMTGFPTTYTHSSDGTAGPSYTAPFTLRQNENPGSIALTFTHRLTKVIVNITKTTETADISMDDIRYSGESDKVFARVTLLNTVRKTWFQVDNTDVVAATRVAAGEDGVDAQPDPNNVIVGKGSTALSSEANSVTLSAIVPPQTITSGSAFIQVDLIDNTSVSPGGPDNITNTFKYVLDSDLTLQASKVHTYNIRINKPNITVSTSITNWVAVDPVSPVGVLQ